MLSFLLLPPGFIGSYFGPSHIGHFGLVILRIDGNLIRGVEESGREDPIIQVDAPPCLQRRIAGTPVFDPSFKAVVNVNQPFLRDDLL